MISLSEKFELLLWHPAKLIIIVRTSVKRIDLPINEVDLFVFFSHMMISPFRNNIIHWNERAITISIPSNTYSNLENLIGNKKDLSGKAILEYVSERALSDKLIDVIAA